MTDVDPIYNWENNPNNWGVSDTKKPYTRNEIIDFINENQSIINNNQLRLMICINDIDEVIGCVDLFEFDDTENSAGVGILIGEVLQRSKGYAKEALTLLKMFAKEELKIKQLFCNIYPENKVSIYLFEACDYVFQQKELIFNKEANHYKLFI